MEDILETAKVLLEKDGKLVPIAFIENSDNIGIILLSFSDNDEKSIQLSILRDVAKAKNADAVILVTESWYVTTTSPVITVEPCKDPKRKECIMIVGECEDGNITLVQLFDREGGKENGKIVFREMIGMGGKVSLKFNFGIKDRKKHNKEKNKRLRI